jgi:hypothetical protein
MAFDRSAGRIDDVALDVPSLQRAKDPELVLPGFIADGDPYVGGQRPLLFMGLDQVQHCLQTRRGLRLCDHVHGRLIAPAVVECDFPFGRRKFQRHCQNQYVTNTRVCLIGTHDVLP